MKNTMIKVFSLLLLLAMGSCKNQEWDFPDYNYSTTYFPYQSPVRTLVLGEDELTDTSLDNKLQFSVGVAIGGLYENTQDRKVTYVVDETLAKNLFADQGTQLLALPKAYYSLSNEGTVVVPKGKMQGYIDVQLTDAFLNDPLSYKVQYVLPLKLTSTETDSLLQGKTTKVNADSRIATDWSVLPKDYTLFAIKYINPFHGKYLHRGKDVLKKADGSLTDQIYRTKFIEDNEIWHLQTAGRNTVLLKSQLRRPAGSPGSFTMLLTFDDKGACVITKDATSAYDVSGTGKFVSKGDEWGGKKRNSIVINYQVIDAVNNETHQATDTLVIRDRDVRLEVFKPVVK